VAAPVLDLTLLPGPDDPPLKSAAYQAELQKFEQFLDENGVDFEYSFNTEAPEPKQPEDADHLIAARFGGESNRAAPSRDIYLGDFSVKLVAGSGSVLLAAIAAWF
jgi:hypothetical protein